MSAKPEKHTVKTISFLSADRTAGGIQRALRDWADSLSHIPNYKLILHAPDTPALNDISHSLNLPHHVLTNLQRALYRLIPPLAAFGPKSDICFVHNGFLAPAARYLAHRTIGVCHNDKPAKFKAVDHLICLTPDGIDKAQKAGWKADNLSLIPHFIEDKPLASKNPNEGALHIISAGRLVAKKNFQLFIDIAARAKSDNPNLRFSLAGTGPEAEALRKYNDTLGSPVSLLGWVDLSSLATEADIFCSPSLDEPYGLVLTEMMQAGLAVLASPSFGASFILDKGRTAPLLPFDDAQPWVDEIHKLDKDRHALDTLQNACTERLQDPIFSRARFEKDIIQLINALS